MEMVIHGRNVEVTPRIRSYIERKIERLDRYMPNISQVRVDVGEEKSVRMGNRMVAQVTLRHVRGTILRAEERTSDLFAAIDAVVDKLYRQIERYKGKRRHRPDNQEDFNEYETAVELQASELEAGTVIRRKRYSTEPMTEDEAIEQLDLLGHDFFVFMNSETGDVNVLYQRKDGNYGLLIPEETR